MFITLTPLFKPCKLSLPNGKYVEVTLSGTVMITKDIILHEVLYVPTSNTIYCILASCVNTKGA